MVEVSCLKDLKAAELFLGFRIGAVGGGDFAVFPVQGHSGLRRLKRYFGNKMSVGAQMVVVLKAFVEHSLSLVLGHPFECSRLDVSQTDVFHCSSPLDSGPLASGWEASSVASRRLVHPKVRNGAYSEVAARLFCCLFRSRVEKKLAYLARRIA